MLKLQFKDSRQAPLWLADERITIGQDHRNSLVLADFGVSLFHAEIRREEGHYYLSDCASETGTLVNGERIGSRYQIRAEYRGEGQRATVAVGSRATDHVMYWR